MFKFYLNILLIFKKKDFLPCYNSTIGENNTNN